MRATPERTKPDRSSVGSGDVDSLASLHRRRLLKAAASSAPLIATLPSGAAMAQASAQNCLIQVVKQEPSGAIAGEINDTGVGTDGYVRINARAERYFGGIQVFRVSVPGSGSETVTIDVNGNLVDTSGLQLENSGPVQLLVIYRAEGDPPNSVSEDCQIKTGLTGWPSTAPPTAPGYCFHPVAVVRDVGPGDGVNTAMTLSCWNSIIGP